jgi:peptidoglycan-associated lipoprotein
MMSMRTALGVVLVAGLLAACGGNDAPEVVPVAPDPGPPLVQAPLVAPEIVAEEALPPVPPPLIEDSLTNRSLDDINLDSPFEPVFFGVDSSELDAAGRAVAAANAEILRDFPTWVITIEGHCDERGTAEYNLALGERRAEAVKAYLVSLGVAANRVGTVSYGKEFPFDPGQNETAWAANRRGHFVVTSR